MSLKTRKELLKHIQERYKRSGRNGKKKILDELIATTGYRRKYAIYLLNRNESNSNRMYSVAKKGSHKKKYDEVIYQSVLTLWHAANQICSKRLVPFIPDLLTALERYGHLSLPANVRNLLLEISPATVDRLLKTERETSKKCLSTTRPGTLLKRQIKIRTFADWNDVVPGFLEGDLVAHCGNRVDGFFLNTLVLTDISSTWTEFFPLLRRSEADVIAALKATQECLPFRILGLDTDNGSEFINYSLFNFCEAEKITFTRSRAYRKNDQAHVEEKNGSIIRKIIGYDRYEGPEAYQALADIYAVLRLYVNFFQPSVKLLSKERKGSKVTKRYDQAKTPCQRLLIRDHIPDGIKKRLRNQYEHLDPLTLLKNLEKLQDKFWSYAWKSNPITFPAVAIQSANNIDALFPRSTREIPSVVMEPNITQPNQAIISNEVRVVQLTAPNKIPSSTRFYRQTTKPRKPMGLRTWRTRKDPLDGVWEQMKLQLEFEPQRTAKSLLEIFIKENPNQLTMKMLRTLQRRVSHWRMQQLKIYQKINNKTIIYSPSLIKNYITDDSL